MDKKRLQDLAGITESTELDKIMIEAAAEKKGDKTLEEGMFGREGYGGEKSPESNVVAELAQMLRDIKVFIRDGNMEDATMMVDRAYQRAAGSARG